MTLDGPGGPDDCYSDVSEGLGISLASIVNGPQFRPDPNYLPRHEQTYRRGPVTWSVVMVGYRLTVAASVNN